MKSEAAGDKVTVPMTEKHVEALLMCMRRSPFLGVPSVHDAAFREIEANIRSQVESGLTGRFNPETHCVVDRKNMKRTMSRMAGPSGGMELKRIEDAYTDMNRWLSPSPETPEPKKP